MRTPSSEHPTGPGGGWVKLHRKLLEWEWYEDAHMVHLLVHLLLTATHEDRKYKGLTIKRGQLVTTIKELADALGAPETSTRRRMKRLKSGGFLTIKVAHNKTTITICNYDSYQMDKKESGGRTAEERRKNGGKVAEERRKSIIIGITRREEKVMRIIPHYSLPPPLPRVCVKSFQSFQTLRTTATAWR